MEKFGGRIADDTLLSELLKGRADRPKFDIEKEFEIIRESKLLELENKKLIRYHFIMRAQAIF